MFSTQINIPAADRAQLVDLLNQQLADLSDLSSQTKAAHWNVRGRHFYQFHKLFEELIDVVEEHIDDLAERISTLGGFAKGTVKEAAQASRLEDFPSNQGDDQGYVEVLAARFAACANQVRLAILAADELDDATTADLLTAISRGLDKSLWFLEAHRRDERASGDSDETAQDDGMSAPHVSEPESDAVATSGRDSASDNAESGGERALASAGRGSRARTSSGRTGKQASARGKRR